jgi:hypothetical protein
VKRIFEGAAIAALLVALPASAEDADFRICDGYTAPLDGNDGTLKSWGWGMADTGAAGGATSEDAVAACDRALADPRVTEAFGIRRALLLRGKAIHQMARDRNAEALATLDQADLAIGTVAPGPFTPRFANGQHLLRAYAAYRLGHIEAARSDLAVIDKAFVYNSGMTVTALAMRLSFERDWPQVRRALAAGVPINPARINQLFWAALNYGDFAEALRLGPQISFTLPRGRNDSEIEGIEDRPYDVIEVRADYAGARAYAFAALGQAEPAKAEIARARQDSAVAARRLHQPGAAEARAMAKLSLWEAAIALRSRAQAMDAGALAAAIKEANLGQLPVAIDLFAQLKPSDTGQATARSLVADLEAQRTTEMRAAATFNFADMIRALPEPKPATGPGLFRVGSIANSSGGFYAKDEPNSPYLGVRYGNPSQPPTAIQDLGLLTVAYYVRKAGKDSFLIDSRLYLTRHIVKFGGQNMGADGDEIRFRILPVNAAELRPEDESVRWRLIRVQDVEDQFRPLYEPLQLDKH